MRDNKRKNGVFCVKIPLCWHDSGGYMAIMSGKTAVVHQYRTTIDCTIPIGLRLVRRISAHRIRSLSAFMFHVYYKACV